MRNNRLKPAALISAFLAMAAVGANGSGCSGVQPGEKASPVAKKGVIEGKTAFRDPHLIHKELDLGCATCHEFLDTAKNVKLDDDYMREFDKLKRFIVRPHAKGTPALLEAVHPENPYTFKPLLSRLVCLDCHGVDRGIEELMGADGKMRTPPIFYGSSARSLGR